MNDIYCVLRRFFRIVIPVGLAAAFFLPVVAEGQVQVAVSIPPQKYFVERIGGDHVVVTVMIPPGAEPHTYEPKPRQLSELSTADVYFTIGIAFERAWLDRFRAVNRTMRIAATDDYIARIPMGGREEGAHDHGDKAEGMDTHIWLSPPLVMLQARVVFDTLLSLDPANADDYAAGYRAFISETSTLDAELRRLFAEVGEQNRFIVFHPSWGYFAQAYGLEQVPIEMAGREPTSPELMNLITFARENRIGVVFVQPQFSTRSAEMIAREIGGTVVVADPLAGDWAENLAEVARAMREALR